MERHVKSGPDDPGTGRSTDPSDVLHADKNVATFIASRDKVMLNDNAVLTNTFTQKRRRAQADGNTLAETDSGLNIDTSTQQEHKKPKKDTAMKPSKAGLGPVDLTSPADKTSKAQEEERQSLLHTFTKKPNTEAQSIGKLHHAGSTKEGLRPKSSNPVSKPVPALDRSSTPKLSSVLNEEYRKLDAASNARRSKSKHARVSSNSSNPSDQPEKSGAPIPKKPRAQPSSPSKNARRSRSTRKSSSSGQSSQSTSSKAFVPEKELDEPEPRNLKGIDSDTPLRIVEPDARPATPEQEIKALRVRTCDHFLYLCMTR